VISSGVAYQYAKEIFPDASFLKLGLTNPIPRDLIRDFTSRVATVYVVEELDPFLEEQILALGVRVQGKTKQYSLGELSPDTVDKAFGVSASLDTLPVLSDTKIPSRPPVLCPGCAHRGIFYAMNKLHLTVIGDIGCYTLGALKPLSAMETCLCMGASVGMAEGMKKVADEKFGARIIGVIGDSTFVHSGITGLIDIVYNMGGNTICILDNRTTAMTGHQEHPGTGITLKGDSTSTLDLEALCRAVGVRRVVKINPYDVEQVLHVLKEELSAEETSVIISDAPCIIKERIKFSAPYYVDENLCVECNVCYKVGCPAIEKAETGKPKINPLLCIGCDICAQVCKPKAILKSEY
jgi:indolepyruvate ferredoxin oxidoreductase alpha subunit